MGCDGIGVLKCLALRTLGARGCRVGLVIRLSDDEAVCLSV